MLRGYFTNANNEWLHLAAEELSMLSQTFPQILICVLRLDPEDKASVLSTTRFNWPVLAATSAGWIPITLTQGFPDINGQQLGIGEKPKLAEGKWVHPALAGMHSREMPARQSEWYLMVMRVWAKGTGFLRKNKQGKGTPWLHCQYHLDAQSWTQLHSLLFAGGCLIQIFHNKEQGY